MRVIRCGKRIEIWAPAKLNLFLEVLGRRGDGYHEIETLMTPISLFDTLRFEDAHGVELEVQLSPPLTRVHADCPDGPENLVSRAVELLREEAGVQRGAKIRLIKRIPSRAGLGGGSSDAAATMIAANIAWGLDWPLDRLARLSSRIGSDIPFFFAGKSALCTGRGENVRPQRSPHFHAVVVTPPEGFSTSEVYQRVDLQARRRTSASICRAAGLTELAGGVFNRLQAAAETFSTWVQQIRTILNGLELVGHQLSGSGSSYFGICRNARHARRVAEVLRAKRLGLIFAVRPESAAMILGTAQS